MSLPFLPAALSFGAMPMRALAVLLAAALASCGGGTLSREQFQRASEGVCVDVRRRLEALPAPGDPDGSGGSVSLESYLDQALSVSKSGEVSVRAFRVPDELERARDLLVETMAKANAALAEAARAASDGNDAALRDASDRLEGARAQFNAVARSLGLERCASDAAPLPSPSGS